MAHWSAMLRYHVGKSTWHAKANQRRGTSVFVRCTCPASRTHSFETTGVLSINNGTPPPRAVSSILEEYQFEDGAPVRQQRLRAIPSTAQPKGRGGSGESGTP